MGTLIYGTPSWVNTKAILFNGSNQLAYKDNPDYHTAMAGCWAFDVTMMRTMTTDGGDQVITMGVTDAGNNARFLFSVRRIAEWGTSMYFELSNRPTNTGTVRVGGATGLAVVNGTTYRVVFGSAGKLYINGTEYTLVSRGGHNLPTAEWYGNMTGSNHTVAFGGLRRAGTNSTFGNVKMDNIHYINRVLTPTEVAEDYSKRALQWSTRSYAADIKHVYEFENNLNDSVGSETFTGAGSPTYVTP